MEELLEVSKWNLMMNGTESSLSKSGQESQYYLPLAKLVRPATVHSNALDPSNADELHADIIAAILLVGNFHQLSGCAIQIVAVADGMRDL